MMIRDLLDRLLHTVRIQYRHQGVHTEHFCLQEMVKSFTIIQTRSSLQCRWQVSACHINHNHKVILHREERSIIPIQFSDVELVLQYIFKRKVRWSKILRVCYVQNGSRNRMRRNAFSDPSSMSIHVWTILLKKG